MAHSKHTHTHTLTHTYTGHNTQTACMSEPNGQRRKTSNCLSRPMHRHTSTMRMRKLLFKIPYKIFICTSLECFFSSFPQLIYNSNGNSTANRNGNRQWHTPVQHRPNTNFMPMNSLTMTRPMNKQSNERPIKRTTNQIEYKQYYDINHDARSPTMLK